MLPNLSTVSPVVETSIEMARRDFRGGGLEYVLAMIMTMILMLLSVGTQSSVYSCCTISISIAAAAIIHSTSCVRETGITVSGFIIASHILEKRIVQSIKVLPCKLHKSKDLNRMLLNPCNRKQLRCPCSMDVL